MNDTLSFVNLNCLNCGANLKITNNIFEFACQHCGATQIVERSGGIVALKLLSDKIDRVQESIDKTAAELKIQRLKSELAKIGEKHTKLEEVTNQLKSFVNPFAIALIVATAAPSILFAAYTNSIFPLLIGGIIEFVVFLIWRKYIFRIDSEFERASKQLIEKSVELKRNIAKLEKIVDN